MIEDIFDYNINSLLNGLAVSWLLNRTLVLPKLLCNFKKCNVDHYINIEQFLNEFEIRESSFTHNVHMLPEMRDEVITINIVKGNTPLPKNT